LVLVRRLSVFIGLLGVAVVLHSQLSATASLETPRTPQRRPDILLVTVDALRTDHLSAHGYGRLTTPAMDAFARRTVQFTSAISQAPFTKASIASLMTGLYPSTHQAVSATVPFPETMTGHVTSKPVSTDVLPASATTIAEALHAAGYRTIGFTANPFLIADFGFAQGFDRFRFYPGPDFARGETLVADLVDEARSSHNDKPLFAWIHLMEPHSPYTPPPLTAGMFKVTDPPEPIEKHISIPFWLLPGSPRDRRPYIAAYDADIAAVDAAFDTLIREFRSVRQSRENVVVVTADHGEQFLDHGGWEHGSNLYDELVHVPLSILAPDTTAAVIDAQVELIDLFSTLLELANADVPDNPGRSLSALLRGKGAGHGALSEIPGSQYSFRQDGFKLIEFNDGRCQLFDLSTDRFEQHDISSLNPTRVARMRAALNAKLSEAIEMRRSVRGESAPVDPAIAERLRALGYTHR
jgi:arylsulfatase A-like enzyme